MGCLSPKGHGTLPRAWPQERSPACSRTCRAPTPWEGGSLSLGKWSLPLCLLEEKWAELSLRGRTSCPLLPEKGGGTQAKAGPWSCRGSAVQLPACRPSRQAPAQAVGREPSLSSAAKHLQSINGLINSLQRPLNYSSWATERAIRACPAHSSGHTVAGLGRGLSPWPAQPQGPPGGSSGTEEGQAGPGGPADLHVFLKPTSSPRRRRRFSAEEDQSLSVSPSAQQPAGATCGHSARLWACSPPWGAPSAGQWGPGA